MAGQSAQPAALKLLAELSTVWLWYTWTCVNGPLQDAAARGQGYLQGFLRSWEPWAAAAQQLELYQQQQSFSRSVSAAELQEVFLLLKAAVCSLLVDWGADQQALRSPALEAARQLHNLRPTNPTYQFKLANGMANAGDSKQAARVLRTVLEAAQASHGAASGWLILIDLAGGMQRYLPYYLHQPAPWPCLQRTCARTRLRHGCTVCGTLAAKASGCSCRSSAGCCS